MSEVVDRFLRYIAVETTSDPKSGKNPSSDSQFVLANQLADELREIGLESVSISNEAYVMACLPANTNNNIPSVGLIAHMDTSPDFTAKNVNPQFVRDYNGEPIVLNQTQNIVLSPKQFPELLQYKGQTLITTDGTTLLGADNKAGIAEIMTAMNHLVQHPEIIHGDVWVCFTPDEEIGQGADHFDLEKFRADFAYTIDGDELGVLEYENFNAASAHVSIKGLNVHPGYAKNKMINSMLIANKFVSMLPASDIPEKTEGYEGFFHLTEIKGQVESTELEFIIRDHNLETFKHRKKVFQGVADQLNLEYGEQTVQVKINDQYYNMLEKIEPVMHVIDLAKQAMNDCGVRPIVKAIRGGTDGARLSYMGLPCPNLFAGGHNFHGKYEFIPISSMEKAVEVIVQIVKNIAYFKNH